MLNISIGGQLRERTALISSIYHFQEKSIYGEMFTISVQGVAVDRNSFKWYLIEVRM